MAAFRSRSRNTPFAGRHLERCVFEQELSAVRLGQVADGIRADARVAQAPGLLHGFPEVALCLIVLVDPVVAAAQAGEGEARALQIRG